MLAWLPSLLLQQLAGGQRVTSGSSPASSLALHPMAAAEGGVDDLLPNIALATTLFALDEVEHNDDDDDMLSDAEPDKEPLRVKRTRRQKKTIDVKMCAWAHLLEDDDLKDETSITAKGYREDFRLHYPLFPAAGGGGEEQGVVCHCTTRRMWAAMPTSGAQGELGMLITHELWRLYDFTAVQVDSRCVLTCAHEKNKKWY